MIENEADFQILLRAGVERETVEASVQNERLRRPTKGRPGLRILAMCELDVEAAGHFTGFSRRGGIQRADDRIARSAANPPKALLEHEIKDYFGLGGDSPVAVRHKQQIPFACTEFDSAGADTANGSAIARRVESQVRVEPEELWRQNPAKR